VVAAAACWHDCVYARQYYQQLGWLVALVVEERGEAQRHRGPPLGELKMIVYAHYSGRRKMKL
jgi:hypothetical protein